MRVNLTKKDLVNRIYMQIGFSKEITENLVDEFFSLIVLNLKKEKQLKISNFGTFSIRLKKSRIGRNPKKESLYPHIQYVFGKKNLNKLNLKFLMVIDDIMMRKTFYY